MLTSIRPSFAWCAIVLALGPVLQVCAEEVRGIRAAVERPIAPRDGVLMVPLIAQKPGSSWPSHLELRLDDGRVTAAVVAWFAPSTAEPERNWTDDPRQINVRTVQPDDDDGLLDRQAGYGPYLLWKAPNSYGGEVRLGKQRIRPSWMPVPATRVIEPAGGPLERIAAPDLPDPESPFEYWRWVLLAEREGRPPPPPQGEEVQILVAEHLASMWRAGLHHLEEVDAAMARRCREALIHLAQDGSQRFAAWVSDPVQTNALLAILTKPDRRDRTLVTEVQAWLTEQDPLLKWTHAAHGDDVRLKICSQYPHPVRAELAWASEPQSATFVTLPPNLLASLSIERPPLPEPPAIGLPAPPEPLAQRLTLTVEGQRFDLEFGPRQVVAKPPGVFFRAFAPPLTLAEVQAGIQRPVSAELATYMQVRRLSGRWEVFLDCRRPASVGAQASADVAIQDFDDLRRLEAVTLLLGDDQAERPLIWLTIPELGHPVLVHGSHDGTLQIHKQAYADRWLCRVVLPEAWFSAAETNPARLGAMRSHGNSTQIETAPNASVPWNPEPTRAALNLEQWDDAPPSH